MISDERIPIGSTLPSIEELREKFECSKNTVIAAISSLRAEGLIARRGSARSGFQVIRQPKEISDGVGTTTARNAMLVLPFNYWHYVGNRLLEVMEDAFRCSDNGLLFSNHKNSLETETEILKRVEREHRTDLRSLILMSSASFGNPNLLLLRHIARKIPIILLDRSIEGFSTHYVGIDNRDVGYRAVEHLVERGHRSIVNICGFSRVNTARERLEGFREGLLHFDLPRDSKREESFSNIYSDRNEMAEIIRQAVSRLLSVEPHPTAFICDSDKGAGAVLEELISRKIAVPGDIAVVGCDDDRYVAERFSRRLTTFRYPFVEIAEQILYLYDTTSQDTRPIRRKIEFEAILVRGDTT